MPVGRYATTLTRPLLSVVAQMCRTFPKSPVNRVARPSRDNMSGTLSSQSRCRMPSRTTPTSPKRSDAWLAETTAVAGTSAFGHYDMRCGLGRSAERIRSSRTVTSYSASISRN